MGYPDVILPTNGSASAMQYVGGIGGMAAIQYGGTGGGGKVITWGFPFETIITASTRNAYPVRRVELFRDDQRAAISGVAEFNQRRQRVTLNWSTSSGLKYRVQYKTNLTDATWQTLGADILATNTITSATDSGVTNAAQRFYRILVLN